MRRLPLFTVVALAAAVLPVLSGCGGKPAPPEPQAELARYTVRGRIVSLPDPASPAAEFVVRHESIPSFMSGGKVVGMASMQMPFPLIKEGVSLTGLTVGQAVTLTLEVEYDPQTQTPASMVVADIQPLPADVTLSFDSEG